MAGIIDVRSPHGAIGADLRDEVGRLARLIAQGRAISTDWQGTTASWPAAMSLIAGRPASDALGRFVFDGILATPDLGAGAAQWMHFLDGGPTPRASAQVRVTVSHPLHRLAATATFVPILRPEAFDTSLFLEEAEHMDPDDAADLLDADYPRLRSALRRALTGIDDVHPDDVVGTLVVLDLLATR